MPKRDPGALRPVTVIPHYLVHPEGCCLIAFGDTKVICTASIEDRVPPFLANKGRGWITAEYDMLPRSTSHRRDRDAKKGKVHGRTQEISRLIGRALRAAVDLERLGERTIAIDCDVIQADGGTRTAAITGGSIALGLATKLLVERGTLKKDPLVRFISAISVGIVDGAPYLDLDYALDSNADVDMNVVMTDDGQLVEIQGTGELAPFRREEMTTLVDLAFSAQPTLVDLQRRAVAAPWREKPEPITA